jgi:hypothetical protein
MAIPAQSSSSGCLKLLLYPDVGDKARKATIIGMDDNPALPLALKPINYFQRSVRRSGGKARAEVFTLLSSRARRIAGGNDLRNVAHGVQICLEEVERS